MQNPPLYQTIYEDLLNKIVLGFYSEKDALPSERSLCDQFHVSRATIRRALDELEKNQYIEKRQGSGNFVKPKMYELPLTKLHSFTGSFRAQHIELTSYILNYTMIESDKYLNEILPVDQQARKWHKLERLRLVKDCPLMVETTYLPEQRFHHIDVEYLKSHSLYAYLEQYYSMHIDDASELLSPIMPTLQEQRLLQISSISPCMLMERICYEEGALIAIHKTTIRGDKYKFRAFYYSNE